MYYDGNVKFIRNMYFYQCISLCIVEEVEQEYLNPLLYAYYIDSILIFFTFTDVLHYILAE